MRRGGWRRRQRLLNSTAPGCAASSLLTGSAISTFWLVMRALEPVAAALRLATVRRSWLVFAGLPPAATWLARLAVAVNCFFGCFLLKKYNYAAV